MGRQGMGRIEGGELEGVHVEDALPAAGGRRSLKA